MSNLEIIFSSEACDIFYNNNLHIIQIFWKGLYLNDEPSISRIDTKQRHLHRTSSENNFKSIRYFNGNNKIFQFAFLCTWLGERITGGRRGEISGFCNTKTRKFIGRLWSQQESKEPSHSAGFKWYARLHL